jgi:hypothetical protein
MNWYDGRSYNLQTKDVWIHSSIWIHMIEVAVCPSRLHLLAVCPSRLHLLMRTSTHSCIRVRITTYASSRFHIHMRTSTHSCVRVCIVLIIYIFVSTDIRTTICVWIHTIAVFKTLQRTFEFILMYELIWWPFIQPTNKGRMNS